MGMKTTMLRPRNWLSLAAAGASLVAASTAAAEDAGPRALSWWVEGRPWTCSDPVGAVARHVSLACDASRCRIAARREDADRIAAIACGTGGGPWRLVAEDRSGEALWSVVLGGDDDARVRKAALWIARAESSEALTDPALDRPTPVKERAASPAPSPAQPVQPMQAVPPTDIAAPPQAPPVAETPAATHAAGDGHPVTMTASLETAAAAAAVQSGRAIQPMAGARFSAALRLLPELHAGAAVDGITTIANGETSTYSHLGGLVAVGAPYAHDWVGASVEGGVALMSTSAAAPGKVLTSPYGKGTFIVQWPREGGIRPYLAVSYLASRDAMNYSLVTDLGVAW